MPRRDSQAMSARARDWRRLSYSHSQSLKQSLNRPPSLSLVVVVAMLGLATACGSSDSTGGPEGPLVDLPSIHVAPEPELAIGMGDDGFGQVAAAIWMANGSIAVADAHNRHVRLFDSLGIETTTAGRRGEGPGEFESVDRLWRVGPDSIAVWDSRLMRYTVVGPDGGTGRPVTLEPSGERARPIPLGWAPDGSLIAVSDARELSEDERYRPPWSLLSYAADGSLMNTLATFQGPEMWNWVWEMGVTPSLVPFGRPTVVDLSGDQVFVGTNDGYRIDSYPVSSGTSISPTTTVSVTHSERELPEELVAAHRTSERDKASSGAAAKGGNDVFGLMAEDAPYPETIPHYDLLLTDDGGRLWVRDYVTDADAPSTFTVFDASGAPAGSVELPARFRPTDIVGGRMLGVWRDALDVEQVRVYSVR